MIVYEPAPLVVTFAEIVPSEGSVSELLMKAFEPPLFTIENEYVWPATAVPCKAWLVIAGKSQTSMLSFVNAQGLGASTAAADNDRSWFPPLPSSVMRRV